MESYLAAIGSAVWLGILTSISPCPLATNIAAITYIGKRVDRPGLVLMSGIVYTLGRMIAYIAIGALVVFSLLSVPDVAMFLQRHMNKFLGPILIVVGFLLLGIIKLNIKGIGLNDKLQKRIENWGVWGAGLFGLLFALSFCPVSAALFFGSLIPLAVDYQSTIIMPTVFGIGTALPVIAFAVIISLGTRFVGIIFNKLTIFEIWARRITAIAFILIGLYLVLTYLFGVNL
jgi:cytochrome c biogenesis protein CcdA